MTTSKMTDIRAVTIELRDLIIRIMPLVQRAEYFIFWPSGEQKSHWSGSLDDLINQLHEVAAIAQRRKGS